jgi:hypothetical protein
MGLLLVVEHARGEELLVRGALVVDGTGAPARAGVDVLVADGRIRAIDVAVIGWGPPGRGSSRARGSPASPSRARACDAPCR